MARREDINRLYELLDELEQTVGGKQKLKDCTGYMDWPERVSKSSSHRTNTESLATSFE